MGFRVPDASDFITFACKQYKNVLMFSESQPTFSLQQFGSILDSLYSQNGILGHFCTPKWRFPVPVAFDLIIVEGEQHKNVLMYTKGSSIYSFLQFGDIYESLF